MGPKRLLPKSIAGGDEQPTPKKIKAVSVVEKGGEGEGSETKKKSGKKVKEVEEKRLARWRTSANELFVFLKVLKQPPTSAYIYQVALVTKELRDIFDAAPINPRDVLANKNVVAAYKGSDSQEGEEGGEEGRRPAEGPCPVCFEDMDEGGKEALTWCRACGNNMHMDCFRQWRGKQVADGMQVTCVYCRVAWVETGAGTPGKGGDVSKEGYRNLADLQGMSTQRDTSTYYQNPFDMGYGRKRGRGWGRGYRYDDDDYRDSLSIYFLVYLVAQVPR